MEKGRKDYQSLEQLLYKERLNRFRSFSWKKGERKGI